MRILQLFAALMCLVGFAACGGGTKPSSQAAGDTVDFKYARLLHAVRHDGYTEVSISDPWHKGKVLHRYVLVPRGGSVPGNVPEGTVVRVPLQRVIPFSVVHAGLVMDLGRTETIVGLADVQYVAASVQRRQGGRRRQLDESGCGADNGRRPRCRAGVAV